MRKLKRTPPLSRVHYQKPNQIEHVSTAGDIIHDRTRFRCSEYMVWLVTIQWIGSPSVEKKVQLFFVLIFLVVFFCNYNQNTIWHICHVNGNQNIKCPIHDVVADQLTFQQEAQWLNRASGSRQHVTGSSCSCV